METFSTSSNESRSGSSEWKHMFSMNLVDEGLDLLEMEVHKRRIESLLDLPKLLNEALSKTIVSGKGKERIGDLMLRIDDLFYTVQRVSSMEEEKLTEEDVEKIIQSISYDVDVACNVIKSTDEIIEYLNVTDDSVYRQISSELEEACSMAMALRTSLKKAQKGSDLQEYLLGFGLFIICKEISESKKHWDDEEGE